MSILNFLSQTRDAINNLPLLPKATTYAWSMVPIIFLIPNLGYRTPLMFTFAVIFSLLWIMMTIAIILITTFHKENKETLDAYTLENHTPKISAQTMAHVVQSKRAFEDLRQTLPPHLREDISLYVGSKWGQISKYTMLSLVAFFFLVRLFTGKYLGG